MKRHWRICTVLLAALVVLGGYGKTFAATNAAQQASEDAKNADMVLKAGHVLTLGSHFDVGLKKFAELVKQKTNGKIIIEVYAGGVLGQERDMIEAMQLNTLDLGLVSTAPLGGFLPAMMLMDLPYLFRDREHAFAVADGEVGKELFKRLEKQRITGLCFMENGFRSITSNGKVIQKPEDLQGVKIRVMENEVHTTAFQKLGAIPVPMASGEVFTGLQQGTINAAENSINGIHSNRYYEVAKELSLTQHFYGAVVLIMSKKLFDSLAPEQQKIFREAAKEACDFQRLEVPKLEQVVMKEMLATGVKVHTVDPAPFQKIFLTVYPEFEKTIPQDLVKKALETKP